MDDNQPQETKPISDDQELAKVLAGVSTDDKNDLNFDETPVVIPDPQPEDSVAPEPPQTDDVKLNADSGDLTDIKKDALNELRPLVDKLDLSAEEKFDTYLLLIRSTDDKSLIEPAHKAAQNITDEAKRAQALLDIIKEIDYLTNPPQPTI